MITKNELKYIKSLSLKKNRDYHQVFIAEGSKCIQELTSGFEIRQLFTTNEKREEYHANISAECIKTISRNELKQMSQLKNPQNEIAIFKKPNDSNVIPTHQLLLALDDIQDPGNLGTIIRVADWYGIEHILCSLKTADCYAPKVVQATMGALSRVKVHYLDLNNFLSAVNLPIYGTFLEGENIYQSTLQSQAVIVMGNEGNGISKTIKNRVTHKITIPPYPNNATTVESLNVAMATGIICSEFRRNHLK